jgi:hypothetical protein
LKGVFTLAAGSCQGGTASGSYFRMILANGSPSGPFLSNSDSTCDDDSYTLLQGGTDGGLRLGEFQPQPSPAFDSNGNAKAARFIRPVRFYGVDFSAATNRVDPQTGLTVRAPEVTASGSSVSADLRALGVSWNGQHFNQGAPKPNGSTPGNTRLASGRYDKTTGVLTLQWTSQIQGGPFNGFTGLWHLTGKVTGGTQAVPAKCTAPAPTRAASPAGTTVSTPVPGSPAAVVSPGGPASPGVVVTPAASAPASAAPTAAGAVVPAESGVPAAASEPVAQEGGSELGAGILLAAFAALLGAGGLLVAVRRLR